MNVLGRLTAAGLTLRVDDDGQLFAGPPEQVTPDLQRLLADHYGTVVLAVVGAQHIAAATLQRARVSSTKESAT